MSLFIIRHGENMTNTIRLAKIYVALDKMQGDIQNEIIPLMAQIGFPDHDLVEKLNAVQEAIQRHYAEYEIKGEEIKK